MIDKGVKMFVTDFDGTLANDNSDVSAETIMQLQRVGDIGIIRVIATGRNLFSLRNVINDDFPVDYIVLSSGIGIYDWKHKQLLQKSFIDENKTAEIYSSLILKNYDFMVQLPVPNNHFFHHVHSANPGTDFITRLRHYETRGIKTVSTCPKTASQFVIICSEEADHQLKLSEEFDNLKIVRATSPFDKKSVWIEILPEGISKASGIEFLKDICSVKKENIVTVGNDYYDLDMLRYSIAKNTYVVENAPKEIRSEFNVIESNLNNGVAKLLEQLY